MSTLRLAALIGSSLLVLVPAGCGNSWAPVEDDDDSGVGDDDDTTAGDDDDTTPTDADGDGWDDTIDCDDSDPALNLDDYDQDDVTTCDGDCDDENASMFPGSPEYCDGIDNDCDGFPEEDGDGVCGMWRLDSAKSYWTVSSLNPFASAQAPTAPIEAAFTIADLGKTWVLTADSWHVMSVGSLSWLTSGARDDLLPELTGQTVQAAVGVPASYSGTSLASLMLATATEIHTYTYDITSDAVVWLGSSEYDEAWDVPTAPDPAAINAAWLDMDNAAGWVSEGDPLASCGEGSHDIEAYAAFLDPNGLFLYDAGTCMEFFERVPSATWNIFTWPGAPAPHIARAATWTGSTLVFFGP